MTRVAPPTTPVDVRVPLGYTYDTRLALIGVIIESISGSRLTIDHDVVINEVTVLPDSI